MKEKNIRRFWMMLEADSRSVEFALAVLGATMSIGCMVGGWFNAHVFEWLPKVIHTSDFAVVAVAYNLHHMYILCGHHNFRKRQSYAGVNAVVFSLLASYAVTHYGWSSPSAPAYVVGVLISVWVFLSLEADRVDSRNRIG